jgi:hypothetical protein
MRTLLKNATGATIGFLDDVSPYRKEIRHSSNALAGWFNPKWGHTGATFDATGARIGEGDLRTALLNFPTGKH